MVTHAVAASRRRKRTVGFQLKGWICLPLSAPTAFNALFRQGAVVSLLRLHVAPAEGHGILTVSAIGLAVRLSLRSRLTLIRLALIRKPQSFGGRVSRPPYRYSYLHLLFHALQRRSSAIFSAHGMLPYHPIGSTASARGLCPIIIHAESLD